MKKILSLAFGILLSAGVYAQDTQKKAQVDVTKKEQAPVASDDGALVDFEKTEYDFGDITQGEVVKHTFKLKNKGKAPLVLSNVLTTCGCTASNWPKEPIKPGQSADIEITFNSTGKTSAQNKKITVTSNASNSPTTLTIKGNVLPKADAATEQAK